ncbi:MAG: NUDIX domain-containing protein [Verrucomicrobiota bacterium]|nr:NUDIX domain-containing protein [Verrucomicrobiota bacterium]
MSKFPTVRTAARAVIIKDGKLLVVTMQDAKGTFYILPGGGQRSGENLRDTLRRECQEELGCTVDIGELLYVREYIGKNHQFSDNHQSFHQVEIVFRATLTGNCAEDYGPGRDYRQIGLAWLDITELDKYAFFPEALKPYFKDGNVCVVPVYMGDIN